MKEPVEDETRAKGGEPTRQSPRLEVVRERLERAPRQPRRTAPMDAIADLVGSVDGLPTDLAARKKTHLRRTGYGQKHPR